MVRDILIGEEGDVVSIAGDFVIGFSDEQHVEDLMLSSKGQYKQHPLTGIDIIDYFHGPLSQKEKDNLRREIMLQVEADGMRKASITFLADGTITVKGEYIA